MEQFIRDTGLSQDVDMQLTEYLKDVKPVMNGYEATKQIRALDDPALAGITILAMAANTFDEDRKKALESGMAWKFIWMRVCVSLRRFIRQQEMTIVRLDYL